MNFAIACDLEGIAGVVGFPKEGLGTQSKQYQFAIKQAVREINAAARALFDSGADKVFVWDNHNGSLNLDYMELDKRVDIVAGVGAKHRWPGLYDKDISGVLLIGYHPMADTYAGILSHTCSSVTYQYVKLNGKSVGEIEIDAASASRLLKAPVIFVASDDKAIAQVNDSLPWAKTVVTKEAIGRNLAVLKHPLRVVDEIYDVVRQAAGSLSRMQLYDIADPVEVEMRFLRLEDAEKVYKSKTRDVELIDPFTVRYTAQSFLEL
ncbi:MAG: M55 family metallopeptidase, partial [Clostridia bacterium]|nr:M55 family metallopeptidase [Clostridia bacterium]